jgi:hypothetical protein
MKLKGDENIMPTNKNGDTCCSRRGFLTKSTSLLVGGTVGAYAASAPAKTAVPAPATPPLPWKWVKLDPLEAGRRAYRYYAHGGCGYAAYMALLSLLREKVRYPWTTLPDKMMVHAAAGYGGHGTLCGALGGACCIINLVAYKDEDDIYRQMIDKLFYWYAEQEFPSTRFDDISPIPKQIKVKAMTPLCHTSVSKWTLNAGVQATSKEKKERCAKVAGEVVYTVTRTLNEYFDGKWTPPAWKPSKEVEHCLTCHGPADMFHTNEKEGMNQQQGHMECLLCHGDHTKVTKK